MPENNGMIPTSQTPMVGELRKVLKRLHYPLEVMLVCARRYAAYPLSYRHLEEMMQERGVFVDHSTVHRWSLKILPVLALIFRRRKRPVGNSWRLDETYIKFAGQWKYLYRAVDKAGDTADFLLTAKRDLAAARRYLERAINLHSLPEKITIDKSGANIAAIKKCQRRCLPGHRTSPIEISEQHHQARSTSRETSDESDDGLPIILECTKADRRNRDNAHDQEGAVALPRWATHVLSRAVL